MKLMSKWVNYGLIILTQVPKNPYCKFYKSVGHNEEECRSFDLMRE